MGFLRTALLLAAASALLALSPPARAGQAMDPLQLRALFLQRLVHYVHWPEEALPGQNTPFVIAAADPAPLRPWFRVTDPTRFRLVGWPAERCHVLYLNTDNPRALAAVLQQVRDRPLLTVGENAAFTRQGGIIGFLPVDGRLRLLANPEAARRAGLGLSARLLELAIVHHAAREASATGDAP